VLVSPGQVVPFVRKLDRLGRALRQLVNTVHDLTARRIGFTVLTGHGASIDTTSPGGAPVFGIFLLSAPDRSVFPQQTLGGRWRKIDIIGILK
jgi:DNA invertase Pin-like site-specific DNA recombinase